MLPFISFQEEFLAQREPSAYVVSLEDRVEEVSGAPPTTSSLDIPSLAEIRESCRDLFTSLYTSFEAHVKEHLAGTLYVVEKQRAIAALKEELYARAASAEDQESRQLYLNYAKVAHLHFSKKAKQLEETVASHALDVPEPQQYLFRTSEQQHDSPDTTVPYFFAALGVHSKRKRKKKYERKSVTHGGSSGLGLVPTAVPAGGPPLGYLSPPPILPAVGETVGNDKAIVLEMEALPWHDEHTDHGEEGVTIKPAATNASFMTERMSRGSPSTLPDDLFGQIVDSSSTASGALHAMDPSDRVAAREKLREAYDPELGLIFGPAASAVVNGLVQPPLPEIQPNQGLVPPPIIMPDPYHSSKAVVPSSQHSPSSSVYSTLSLGLGCLVAGLAAATLSFATVAYFNRDSSDTTPKSTYSPASVHVAPSSPTPSYAPVETSPAPVSVSAQEPSSSSGVYYFPPKAPVTEHGKPQVSADWYQIKSAVQEGTTFTMTVGNGVSLDGRVARFGIDTDGDGKANKIIYRPLDHQIKIILPESATVVHAGFGVKSPAGMTYLSSVSF